MKNAATDFVKAVFAACTAHRETDGARWFQTFPAYGRYPVGGTVPKAREDAEFVFDEAAAKSIMEDFAAQKARADWPGVLVDREHFSADPDKSSDAMAWATDIRQEADGSIWTRWDFTPEGERLWNEKVLVSRSPLFRAVPAAGGREYHPVALESIAMTNTPHFKELSTLAAAREAAEVNKNKGTTMDKDILAALGLAEGAEKEEVLAAIRAMKDKASAAEAAASDAEKERDKAVAECRSMKADAFIEANKAKIADTAACRTAYLKDPELAEAMVAACKAPEAAPAKQQVLAAASAKTPAKADDNAVAAARQAKVNEYMAGHPGAPFHVAWSACRQAYPEIFSK